MSQPSYSPHQQQSGLVLMPGALDMSGNADTGPAPDCASAMANAVAHHVEGPFGPGQQASGVTKMPESERGPQN
jgi:hypothetical protein